MDFQISYITPEQSGECAPSPVALDPLCSTLLIPLAARAFGDARFPQVAVHDVYAAPALQRMGADVSHFLKDLPSVYGVLSRTQVFRQLASDFFQRHPGATGVNLGCGLACYFQWLDQGDNHWIDADKPQVMRLRDRLLPADGERQRSADIDLTAPHWWHDLQLPSGAQAEPVLVILEGVLMYLQPGQVESLLREFGDHAPPGSELLCDTFSWMAVGCAALHASVCHTHAEFNWGLKRMSDLTAPHPRRRIKSEHPIMEGYDIATSVIFTSFRAFWGVPLYAIMRLTVDEESRPSVRLN